MIWLLLLLVALIWLFITRYVKSSVTVSANSDMCPSPDCVRCSVRLRNIYIKQVYTNLNKLYSKYEGDAIEGIKERLHCEVDTLEGSRRPTICYLKDVCDEAWHSRKQQYLQEYLTDSYSTIKTEFMSAMSKDWCWTNEKGETGAWRKLFLYNQGKQVTSNKSVAPKTFLLLDNLDTFMKGTIFGNAFFSVLEPHSSIPAHCGPTNLRVRCHLGIQIPSGDCSITVAGVEDRWASQECLLFDDSFEHTAQNSTDSPRLVFIVDLWHPNLTLLEVQILSDLFAAR